MTARASGDLKVCPRRFSTRDWTELVRTLDHTRFYTASSNQVNLRSSGPYIWEPAESYCRINRGLSVELGMPSIHTIES